MKFSIDRKFAKRIKSFTWDEIRYGMSKGWFEPGIAVDKAVKSLETGDYCDAEAELAGVDFSDAFEIEVKVNEIAQIFDDIDISRWAKIALAWLFENKDAVDDPLIAVEELYADFEYPEEISHLVGYMPHEGERKDLIREWELFLNNEVYSKHLEPENP